MNRNKFYIGVNGLTLILAAIIAVIRAYSLSGMKWNADTTACLMIPLFIIGLLVVHVAKLFRCYLVLIERKINFGRFIRIYIKTTFVNISLPFKIGELFRIYCFSKETNNVKVGLLSVVIDRFFDTCALLVLLIPVQLFAGGKLSAVSVLLLFFVLGIVFMYLVFQPTYQYLNHFLIMNTTSRGSVRFLYFLETAKSWYDYIKALVKGRYALIFLFSCMGWIAEFGVLTCMTLFLKQSFGIQGFVAYLESIFTSGTGMILDIYTTISSIVFAVITGAVYIVSFVRKRRAYEC